MNDQRPIRIELNEDEISCDFKDRRDEKKIVEYREEGQKEQKLDI